MAESSSVASAECASLAGADVILNSKIFEMFQWSYIIYFDSINVISSNRRSEFESCCNVKKWRFTYNSFGNVPKPQTTPHNFQL